MLEILCQKFDSLESLYPLKCVSNTDPHYDDKICFIASSNCCLFTYIAADNDNNICQGSAIHLIIVQLIIHGFALIMIHKQPMFNRPYSRNRNVEQQSPKFLMMFKSSNFLDETSKR